MRRIIRTFDAFLANALGVFEFTQDPDCILRLQRSTLHHDLALPDARFAPGTPVLAFHLWNERVPPLPRGGSDLPWALSLTRRLIRSFRMVASYLASDSGTARPRAIGGVTVLGPASGSTADVLAHLGFHVVAYRNPLGHFGEWWENAYTWSLMWAYNPESLRGKQLRRLRRREYWMSTAAFLDRFAAARC